MPSAKTTAAQFVVRLRRDISSAQLSKVLLRMLCLQYYINEHLDIPRESVISKMNFIKMKNEKSKKSLFDAFLRKTKKFGRKTWRFTRSELYKKNLYKQNYLLYTI